VTNASNVDKRRRTEELLRSFWAHEEWERLVRGLTERIGTKDEARSRDE
jgi:hypothetical protein